MSDDESKGAGAAAGTDSQAYIKFKEALKAKGKDVNKFQLLSNEAFEKLMNKYGVDVDDQGDVIDDFRKHFPLPTNTERERALQLQVEELQRNAALLEDGFVEMVRFMPGNRLQRWACPTKVLQASIGEVPKVSHWKQIVNDSQVRVWSLLDKQIRIQRDQRVCVRFENDPVIEPSVMEELYSLTASASVSSSGDLLFQASQFELWELLPSECPDLTADEKKQIGDLDMVTCSDADDENNIQDSFDSYMNLLVRGTLGRYYFNTSKSSRFQASGALHLEDLYDATVEEKRNLTSKKPKPDGGIAKEKITTSWIYGSVHATAEVKKKFKRERKAHKVDDSKGSKGEFVGRHALAERGKQTLPWRCASTSARMCIGQCIQRGIQKGFEAIGLRVCDQVQTVTLYGCATDSFHVYGVHTAVDVGQLTQLHKDAPPEALPTGSADAPKESEPVSMFGMGRLTPKVKLTHPMEMRDGAVGRLDGTLPGNRFMKWLAVSAKSTTYPLPNICVYGTQAKDCVKPVVAGSDRCQDHQLCRGKTTRKTPCSRLAKTDGLCDTHLPKTHANVGDKRKKEV